MKFVLLTSLALIISSSSWAKTKSSKSNSSWVKTKSRAPSNGEQTSEAALDGTNTSERKTDLQISLQTQDLRLKTTSDQEEAKVSGAALNLGLGYRFFTTGLIDVTTYATANLAGYDGNDFQDDEDRKDGTTYSIGSFDFGLAQKLGYNLSLGASVLTPFIQGGINYGVLSMNSESPVGNAKTEIAAPYTRLSLAAGLALNIGNIAPFIKYEYSKMNFSGDWNVKASNNTSSIDREIRGPDLDSDNQSIAIGASLYL